MITKQTDVRKIMKYIIHTHKHTHSIPPTCFGHSCGHPRGSALQRIDTSKCYRSFWTEAQI